MILSFCSKFCGQCQNTPVAGRIFIGGEYTLQLPQPFVCSLGIQAPVNAPFRWDSSRAAVSYTKRLYSQAAIARVKHREKRKTSSSFDHNTCLSNENLIVPPWSTQYATHQLRFLSDTFKISEILGWPIPTELHRKGTRGESVYKRTKV